jgi:Lar family restriction alleviation protein
MKEELKSCPFCGGKPRYKTFYDGFTRFHRIKCLFCKVFIDRLEKDEAIAAWNKRIGDGDAG